jgi:drug/metabolite transporter (DMT)-like permease
MQDPRQQPQQPQQQPPPQPLLPPPQPAPPPPPPPSSPPHVVVAAPSADGRVRLLRIKPGAAAVGLWSPPGTPSKSKAPRTRSPPAAVLPAPPPAFPPPRPLPVVAPLLSLLYSSGLACGLLAALLNVAGNSLVKELQPGAVPVAQLILLRALISVALTALLASAAKTRPIAGRRANRGLLAARGLAGVVAVTLWYVSLQRLPLGDAVAISLLGPPLTALLAFLLLREVLGLAGACGCCCALLGVLVVAKPPFLFGAVQSGGLGGGGEPAASSSSSSSSSGALAGVLAALANSMAMIVIRRIGHSEPAIVVAGYFHVFSGLASAASLLLALPSPPRRLSLLDGAIVVAVGTLMFFAQLFSTRSFQLLPAAVAASLVFTQVGYSYAAGALFFGERMTASAAAGTALLALGVALVTVRAGKEGKGVDGRGGGNEAAVAAVVVDEAGPGKQGDGEGLLSLPQPATAPVPASRRRLLVTQHSLSACGDGGGALFGGELFVAAEPPLVVQPVAAAVVKEAAASSSPATTTAMASAFASAPAARPSDAAEPTAIEALAADPLVVAAARLYTRASSRVLLSAGSGGGAFSRAASGLVRQASVALGRGGRGGADEAKEQAAVAGSGLGSPLPSPSPEAATLLPPADPATAAAAEEEASTTLRRE